MLSNNTCETFTFQMDPQFPELPHQKALQQKYQYLVESIRATDVIDYLFQEGWLTLDDKEVIDEIRGERQKTRKLVTILISKPEVAFQTFLFALKETGTEHAVEELEQKLADIKHQTRGKQH